MTCLLCGVVCKKFGKDRQGYQRYRCRQCSKVLTEPHHDHISGMYLSVKKAASMLQMMMEGLSIRSIERLTGVHHDTILKLLVQAGAQCERLLQRTIQAMPVTDVQCDEIWGFVGCKEKHNYERRLDRGDAYCFVAIERHSKLVLAWHLGRRTANDTERFIEKLNYATSGRFQLTTDGFAAYPEAVHYSLGTRVDFAQLVKVYGAPRDPDERYSPASVVSAIPLPRWGTPDPQSICTSHVERHNLTMRMQLRRLTRLTNAFSKKWDNLKAALAAYFAHYNFTRVHGSLRVTPAMEARLTDHVWGWEELLTLASLVG
jgi:transposase-like protein/IS1 family transposase